MASCRRRAHHRRATLSHDDDRPASPLFHSGALLTFGKMCPIGPLLDSPTVVDVHDNQIPGSLDRPELDAMLAATRARMTKREAKGK
jgi:hypothetical protein